MKPIAPNTLIQNRYLIVHLIGKGGMGEVYLAIDQRLGSAIALKRTFFSDDATLGQAFEREARTLARLRHPVLPKVSDHFTEAGTQYLVMEHISGEDISKRLETAEKLFPVSWVLFWADQLLDALNYLHTHEPPIIHRDIKPQNLKLTDENHIVLLDFGLSKNSVGETRDTTGGSIVGYTPHYAAMEQIRGTGTDARSDIYSLSATLYQILTNTIPPDALTRADSLINGLPDPVPPINELNPEVSKAVSDVIIKGISISQEQRYKTAREMQKALRDAYAQLQSDMSANTIAFNIAGPNDLPQSPSKTAELTGSPEVTAMPAESTKSPSYVSGATGSKTDAIPAASNIEPEPNFDATIGYDAYVQPPVSKQSDIRTEVFLAGSSDAIASVQNESHQKNSYSEGSSSKSNDTFANGDNTDKTNLDVVETNKYAPDATVPLFSFDKNAEPEIAKTAAGLEATTAYNDNKTTGGATFIPVENESPRTDNFTPPPLPATAQPKSGKGMIIAGGLFALLVLAIGATGIGWYLLKDNSVTTDNATPTPTVETTTTVEPTAAPTLEVTTTANTSTNTEVIASGNTNSSVTNTTGTPRQTPTTVQTTVQPTPVRVTTPRPTPQIVTVKTPTATAKTPTPVKTPKGGRTDILQ